MSNKTLARPYLPNPILKALYAAFFDRIQVDDTWVAAVHEHAAKGQVGYILRSLNFIDFLALDHLTKRHNLPQIHFANDLGLWVLNPTMGGSWLRNLLPTKATNPAQQLKDALSREDASAALFLKRPPGVLDVAAGGASGGRGLKEGDALMAALIQVQRASDRPILLVPQVFVWSKRPDTRGTKAIDRVLGPREWPSAARVVGQYLRNFRSVALRAGEPINLQQFLQSSQAESESQVLNRIVYTMLRRLERERRSVTGPAQKSADRVRQEILRSRRFQSVLDKQTSTAQEREDALRRADEMLRKMQALPDGATHNIFEAALDRIFQRIYAGIDVDEEGLERVRQAGKESTLVLLPSHKSHIDYLVVSYVFFKANQPLPLIVAGDNLSFFPMGGLFRRAGAFFIRRTFRGDRLYAAVVDAYVRRIIKDGYAIEVFLEGMRSRTGKLLPPKFGLLSMIIAAALGQDTRKLTFVPISIGYERIVETGAFHHEISGGEKSKEDAAALISATEVLRHRYGRINLQFGHCLTLSDIANELQLGPVEELSPKKTRTMITRLGNRVMDEINRVTAVTPGALTALALLSHHRRGLPHDKLVRHSERLHDTLRSLGARGTPTLATSTGVLRREAIREAAQMFADADMIEVHSVTELARGDRRRKPQAGYGAVYTLVEGKRVELDTSKNIIVHFFVERALVATGMLPPVTGPLTLELLRERVQYLSRLFKYEFRFQVATGFEAIFNNTVKAMSDGGDLAIVSDEVRPGNGRDGWSGHKWLLVYASLIRNFLEGYRIFVRALPTLLDEPLAEKDLLKKALATGNRMYLAGEVERRESVSKPVFQNALSSFTDQRVIRTAQGKHTLTEEFQTEGALKRLEAVIATYLDREGAL